MAIGRQHIWPQMLATHVVLIVFSVLAVGPTLLILVNSFKDRRSLFQKPLALPTPETFDIAGYVTVFTQGNFPLYLWNSVFVTVLSLTFILLIGAMAAFALSEYRFALSRWLGLYLALGIMIPIRLGTVGIMNLMVATDLVGTLWALILVYTAQGLPLAVFILSEFMAVISRDLKDAGRMDGLSEYVIFARLVLPLVRPALATVAVFSMIPIWNDLWFPLVLAPAEQTKTLTLGAQAFVGQYTNDWGAILAAVSVAVLPVLLLYAFFSRQLIRGLTSGAVK